MSGNPPPPAAHRSGEALHSPWAALVFQENRGGDHSPYMTSGTPLTLKLMPPSPRTDAHTKLYFPN